MTEQEQAATSAANTPRRVVVAEDESLIRLDIVAILRDNGFDVVGGIEARGFLLAGAIAAEAGVGLVPIRKAGKLPRPAASVSYALEYGEAAIEAHDDLAPGTRILLVDDVLATGGTIAAARELMTTLGAEVIGTTVLLELEGLNGRAVAGDVHALFVV